mmetsp:Transcript_8723/g.20877  ORF Transcript_8723/g.20877 Transcript_8723/m.20877 type:complete len:240 (+) Transcript_8723:141-860(+)
MDQQLRGAISRNGPLEESATQIQALVRGFLCRKDNFVIEVRPGIQRYASYVSALTVEGFASQRSLCSYQLDDDCEESNLADEHPGFEGSKNLENEYHSPIRKPRRIASKESTGSSMFRSNGMITVDEDDDEHPGFTDSPNSDEEPVKRPTRLLSKESIQSGSSWLDEGDLLFSPKTVDAACAPSKKTTKQTTEQNDANSGNALWQRPKSARRKETTQGSSSRRAHSASIGCFQRLAIIA